MSETLAGKISFVTGGSRGIGRAIALKLARAGCDVAIVYHNSHEKAEEVCSDIRSLNRRALAIQADVSSPESIAEAFTAFREQFDRVDILVSNAAIGVLRPALELTLKHWRRCMETNALSLNLLAQQAVPLMTTADGLSACRVSVLNVPFRSIHSLALRRPPSNPSRAVWRRLGQRGIRVNIVSAGVVDTDALKFFPNREQLLAEFARRTPAGPTLTPEDVAGAVYLLCLPEAAMITGHTLVVDGGYCISG
jgi:enoyl-[acyl-carrier protein] reductase III